MIGYSKTFHTKAVRLKFMDLVDVGIYFRAANINCCNGNTCCVASRAKRIEVQSQNGRVVKLKSTSILIFEKSQNGIYSLRPKKIFERTIDIDTLYQSTMARFYAKLCNQFAPSIVHMAAIGRGVDFVEKYSKAQPLILSDVSVIKKGLEKILPMQKSLLWLIEMIHLEAKRVGEISYLSTSSTALQVGIELMPTESMTTGENIKGSLLLEEESLEGDQEKLETVHLRTKLCTIMGKRDIFDFKNISLISAKLHNLVSNDTTPKTLPQLAEQGITAYLRNCDADRIIFAAKRLHLIFEENVPEFIKNANYQLSLNDLQKIYNILESRPLSLIASVKSIELKLNELTIDAKNQAIDESPTSLKLPISQTTKSPNTDLTDLQEVELDNESE